MAAVPGPQPPSNGPVVGEDLSQSINERLNWQVNAPVLYDLFLGCTSDWPALSAAWLPDVPGENCRLVYGTHTDGSEPHQVVVVELDCVNESEIDAGSNPWQSWKDEAIGKIQGFGCSCEGNSPLRVIARLEHPTEVNRVAPCPHRAQLLATKAATGAVHLFDYKAERNGTGADATLTPSGHPASDGFALVWSPLQKYLLASGGDDGRLYTWNVEVAPVACSSTPLCLSETHRGSLCDLSFSTMEEQVLASVGDDCALNIWDLRTATKPRLTKAVSKDEVLTVDWCPHDGQLLATAGKDCEIQMWDLRSLASPLKSLRGHAKDVVCVKWAPFRKGLLASCSVDQHVILWDLAPDTHAGDGDDDSDDDGEPDELFFRHSGHSLGVTDVAWCSEDFLLCSVSEDNTLQIWKPTSDCYQPDSDGEGEAEQEPPTKRTRGDDA